MKMLSWVAAIFSRHGTMLFFTGANLALQVSTLTSQFIVLRFIAPSYMGVWQTITVIESYLLISRLGIINAMGREYPYFLGKEDKDNANGIVQTSQAYAIMNGVLVCSIFVILGLFYSQRNFTWCWAFFTMALTAPLQLYISYIESTFRSRGNFKTLSWIRLIQVPIILITLVLPWLLDFAGFCIRSAVIALFAVGIAYIARPVRLGPHFQMKFFRLLFSTGWRLFLWSYLYDISYSFPRLVLVWLGGTLSLGLFTPVHWSFIALKGVTGSFSAYLYPILTYRNAKENISVGKIAMKAAIFSTLLFLPVAIVGIILLPWILPAISRLYEGSVNAAQIALIASLLECMSVATLTFASLKAWNAMSIYIIFSLFIRSGCTFAGFFAFKDRLIGVSIGMLASSLVMGIVTWLTVRTTYAQSSASKELEFDYDIS